MASQVFNEYKRAVQEKEIDLGSGGDTIKARLCMTNTTCGTQNAGISTLSDFTTIDGSDDGSYADLTLASQTIVKDDGNLRTEWDASDLSFSGLDGNGSRKYRGVLLYKFVTDDTDSVPICFVEFDSDKLNTAPQIDVPWNVEGILQST